MTVKHCHTASEVCGVNVYVQNFIVQVRCEQIDILVAEERGGGGGWVLGAGGCSGVW